MWVHVKEVTIGEFVCSIFREGRPAHMTGADWVYGMRKSMVLLDSEEEVPRIFSQLLSNARGQEEITYWIDAGGDEKLVGSILRVVL